jgi:hypothetical protein
MGEGQEQHRTWHVSGTWHQDRDRFKVLNYFGRDHLWDPGHGPLPP